MEAEVAVAPAMTHRSTRRRFFAPSYRQFAVVLAATVVLPSPMGQPPSSPSASGSPNRRSDD